MISSGILDFESGNRNRAGLKMGQAMLNNSGPFTDIDDFLPFNVL